MTIRKATLRDVAQLAGVCRMTVTRLFLRPDQVLPATRARVQEAVAALGYVPNRAAGSLATRRSGFVGLIVPTIANGNFAALAEGLTDALHPSGYELLIGYTSYSMAEEERQVRTILSHRPEALVLAATTHRDSVRGQLAADGHPGDRGGRSVGPADRPCDRLLESRGGGRCHPFPRRARPHQDRSPRVVAGR